MNEHENDSSSGPIAYMMLAELSPDLYRGGLLVVDEKGKPLDFRCTAAVRPGPIQKVLYGQSLSGHLVLDLCGIPLLEAAGVEPDMIFTNRADFLGLADTVATPFLWLRRQDELESAQAAAGPQAEAVPFAAEDGRFDPILVSAGIDRPEDLPPGLQILEELSQNIDPLEPFDRIEAALGLVQARPERKKS